MRTEPPGQKRTSLATDTGQKFFSFQSGRVRNSMSFHSTEAAEVIHNSSTMRVSDRQGCQIATPGKLSKGGWQFAGDEGGNLPPESSIGTYQKNLHCRVPRPRAAEIKRGQP